MKILLFIAEVFIVDGRAKRLTDRLSVSETDRQTVSQSDTHTGMTKLIIAFNNFANAPNCNDRI